MSAPVAALDVIGAVPPARAETSLAARSTGASFSQLLANGVEIVDQKVIDADAMAKSFALDDSVPLHQVTYALEQARLSFELMLQIRTQLVEAYREITRMQI